MELQKKKFTNLNFYANLSKAKKDIACKSLYHEEFGFFSLNRKGGRIMQQRPRKKWKVGTPDLDKSLKIGSKIGACLP